MQIASNTFDRLYGDLATLHSNQFGVLFIGNWQMPGRSATLGEQKKKNSFAQGNVLVCGLSLIPSKRFVSGKSFPVKDLKQKNKPIN